MSSELPHLHAVILAGGAGTRFWPASRRHRPKQLLPLAGDARPLLAATVERVAALCPPERILVATGRHLVAATAETLPGLPPNNLLAEPEPRNTAPCVGWAAAAVRRRDPDAVLMILPADHHVADVPRFLEVVRRAVASAAAGVITTVGLRPARAETGYGYIETERAVTPDEPGPVPVARFVEKPDRARAEAFVRGGRHLWNSGMFFFRADVILEAIRRHLPSLADGLETLDRAAARGEEERVLGSVFTALPAISLDHGVMEHAAPLAVVPGEFGWSDVGSWESAWELAPKDEHGNAAPSGALLVDSSDNLIVDLRRDASQKLIALAGVRGQVLVVCDDALLLVPRGRSQDVRALVDELGRRGRGGLL